MKRRKSIVSQAASISAWCAVFDWLSIVAALSVERHGPASSSAARRNTATRSYHGVAAHSACAFPRGGDRALDVGGIALRDVGEDVLAVVRHHRLERRLRLDPLAADHERDRRSLARQLRQAPVQLGALGRARRVRLDRLVDGGRHAEDRGSAHAADCRVGSVDVTRHRYAVEGWGVGEIAVRGEVLVEHALPSRRRRLPARAGGPHGGASTPEVTLAGEPVTEE